MSNAPIRSLHLVDRASFPAWRAAQTPAVAQWLAAHGFDGAPGTALALPGGDGLEAAVLGVGDRHDPLSYAHAPMALPVGDWRVESELETAARNALQLGWGLGSYRYARFRSAGRTPARLLLDAPDAETADVLAACVRTRDLVNAPTEQLGPEQMHEVVEGIAR